MTKLKTTLLALFSVALLAACGGGGSEPDAPKPVGGGAGAIPAAGTLVAAAPPNPYQAGTSQARNYDALNTIRVNGGFGALQPSVALTTSAQAHADYLALNAPNWEPSFHQESASKPGFYGESPGQRMARAGWTNGANIENVGAEGTLQAPSTVTASEGQMNTVYHAISLLAPYTHVGFGASVERVWDQFLWVANLGRSSDTSQIPPSSSTVAVYPLPGSTGLPGRFWVGNEVPRPPAHLLPGQQSGSPVIVSLLDADYVNARNAGKSVTVTRFVLRDAAGAQVDAVVLMNVELGGASDLYRDPLIQMGFAVLVPKAPLANGTYTATFEATVDGKTRGRTWSFTVDRSDYQ